MSAPLPSAAAPRSRCSPCATRTPRTRARPSSRLPGCMTPGARSSASPCRIRPRRMPCPRSCTPRPSRSWPTFILTTGSRSQRRRRACTRSGSTPATSASRTMSARWPRPAGSAASPSASASTAAAWKSACSKSTATRRRRHSSRAHRGTLTCCTGMILTTSPCR